MLESRLVSWLGNTEQYFHDLGADDTPRRFGSSWSEKTQIHQSYKCPIRRRLYTEILRNKFCSSKGTNERETRHSTDREEIVSIRVIINRFYSDYKNNHEARRKIIKRGKEYFKKGRYT